jgi:hypothetical protein
MGVTTAALERYQRERLDAKKAPATVNREVHALRRAFNVSAHQTPPLFPKHLVPYFPSLPVDNVRSGSARKSRRCSSTLKTTASATSSPGVSGPACARARLRG